MLSTIRIKGADMGSISIGKRATLMLEDGRWISTSPVLDYFVANSQIVITTANHMYATK